MVHAVREVRKGVWMPLGRGGRGVMHAARLWCPPPTWPPHDAVPPASPLAHWEALARRSEKR